MLRCPTAESTVYIHPTSPPLNVADAAEDDGGSHSATMGLLRMLHFLTERASSTAGTCLFPMNIWVEIHPWL